MTQELKWGEHEGINWSGGTPAHPSFCQVRREQERGKLRVWIAFAVADPAMPAPLLPLLLRTLMSRLLLPATRLARRHLLPLLRRLARRLGSQDVREALLGCLLFILSQSRPPDAEEVSRVAGQERRERLAPPK